MMPFEKILMVNFPTEVRFNWGCAASSEALGKIVAEKYPDAEIRAEPIFWEKIPESIYVPLEPAEFPEYLSAWMEQAADFFEPYRWADMVIVDGEGSMHDYPDMAHHPEPLRILLRAYAAKKLLGKKVQIINHSISFLDKKYHPLVKTVYEAVDYVSVREPLSVRFLESLGIDSVLAPDAAFRTTGVPKKKINSLLRRAKVQRPYFVLMLSQLVRISPSKVKKFVLGLKEMTGMRLFALAAGEPEKERLRPLQKKISFPIYDMRTTHNEVVSICEQSEFIVSGRFHCSIFAALAKTPFAMLRSNTYKMEGLSELLGLEMVIPDIETEPMDKVLYAIEDVFSRRKELRKILEKSVVEAIAGTNRLLLP